MQKVLGEKYKIIKKIDHQLNLGIDITTGENIIVKIQKQTDKYSILLHQGHIMQQIQSQTLLVDRGIPQLYFMGSQDNSNFIVRQMLGQPLSHLLKSQSSKTFTLKTTLMLFDQMLRRIQFLHQCGIINRDVRIDNFIMGRQNRNPNKLYLLSFGLSRKYIKNNSHITFKSDQKLLGAPRWVSINVLMGITPSRRDDLISLMYVVVYMLKGCLPWQNQQAFDKEELYNMILSKKIQYRGQLLFKNMPSQLMLIYQHISALQFEEQPNYQLYKKYIHQCIIQNQIQYDYQYDWN